MFLNNFIGYHFVSTDMEILRQANLAFSFEILRTPNTLILSHKYGWYIFRLCG